METRKSKITDGIGIPHAVNNAEVSTVVEHAARVCGAIVAAVTSCPSGLLIAGDSGEIIFSNAGAKRVMNSDTELDEFILDADLMRSLRSNDTNTTILATLQTVDGMQFEATIHTWSAVTNLGETVHILQFVG